MSDEVRLSADALTVEYDTVKGRDSILLRPFPDPQDAGVWITGSLDDLRGVVDSMSRLLDDLDESVTVFETPDAESGIEGWGMPIDVLARAHFNHREYQREMPPIGDASWVAMREYPDGQDFRFAREVYPIIWSLIRAELCETIANKIAGSVSYGFELNYDGSENVKRAAYVEGLRDAVALVRSVKDQRE